MTTSAQTPLVKSFIDDHKAMMRLLRDVSVALNEDDVAQAKMLAEELNRLAGPHIAFEETVLYPLIDDQTGDRPFVENLYAEHQEILEAISQLADGELSPQKLEAVRAAFQSGLDHAEHCGTLISRLSSMSEADQQDAQDELDELRERNITWTQLRKGD